MKCPACDGEGGRVTWLKELDDEEFVWCRRCNGHGFIEETTPLAHHDVANEPRLLSESESNLGQMGAGDSRDGTEASSPPWTEDRVPSAAPGASKEPFDFYRERIERHDQESLSRLEQTP